MPGMSQFRTPTCSHWESPQDQQLLKNTCAFSESAKLSGSKLYVYKAKIPSVSLAIFWQSNMTMDNS